MFDLGLLFKTAGNERNRRHSPLNSALEQDNKWSSDLGRGPAASDGWGYDAQGDARVMLFIRSVE